MKIRRGRFLALFLALCLALPGGVFSSALGDSSIYGMTTDNGVRVRKTASASAPYWFLLEKDYICTIEGETDSEGIHWFKVNVVHPEPENERTYIGFIHGDYFRRLTDVEEAEYVSGVAIAKQREAVTAAPTANTAENNVVVAPTMGVVTNGGTNFREGPSMKAHSLMKLDRGTEVQILSVPETVDENHWYGVAYAGYTGYIRSDFIRYNGSITAAPTNTSATVTTPAPTGTGTSAVTPTPTPTPVPTSSGEINAVQLILSSCHLRLSPGGKFDSDNDWLGKGSVLPLAGAAVSQGNYLWYPVSKDGKVYYVRSDCVQPIGGYVTPTPIPTGYIPTPTPAPTSAAVVGYVMTIKGGVNLRNSINGTVIKTIGKYITMPYLLQPVKKNGYTWYYVQADENRGYIRGDCVKVVDPGATPTPTAAPTGSAAPTATGGATATPTPADGATGYVITIANDVNLRTKAGYTPTMGRVKKGVLMPYYGAPTEVKGVRWYYVKHPTMGMGYIHGSYVNIVNGDGSATPTPQYTASPTGGAIVTGGSQMEASYNTLRLGATGNAVKNLVTALKAQGYFTGDVISRYTSAVQAAVKAFQKAKGLSVDGIAGAATQHALFGTVPIGAADSSNLSMTLYAAEKIDWWTGGINELWAKGANYKVYDVKTGIVWWAHRWSGGYHVDAEPLTAADTARLCKCYGVTAASEITSTKHYERRPCLVTIGTRTFACSLYGVPHNYPEGDTISTNDFRGQLCIHFTNSWTHGSKKVDSGHTEAIQYAWEHAPNGHK